MTHKSVIHCSYVETSHCVVSIWDLSLCCVYMRPLTVLCLYGTSHCVVSIWDLSLCCVYMRPLTVLCLYATSHGVVSIWDLSLCCVYIQAPLIPYITEQMFQNMRHLLDPESVAGQDIRSVHFTMIPEPRYTCLETFQRAASTGLTLSKSKSFHPVLIKFGEYVGEHNISTKFYNQANPPQSLLSYGPWIVQN